MRKTALLAMLASLMIAGCGGEESEQGGTDSGTPATAATQEPTSTPTPTPTEEPDSDGDGSPDSEDFKPKDDKVQTADQADDCDVLGINPEELKEGECEADDGMRIKVVNRGSELKLRELSVRLLSIEPTSEIARPYDSPLVGGFVVARVSVTNRLNSPVEIDGSDMFALLLGNKQFSPNFDAMNTGNDDTLIYEEMQPEETRTGTVVFNVPARRANGLSKDGNLVVLQFSDAGTFGNESPSKRVGFIRTYN